MRAIVCGANGAMGKLICANLGEEVVGRVSIDGENNVPKTFAELGKVEADVLIDFSHHTAIADVLAYAKEIGVDRILSAGPLAKELAHGAEDLWFENADALIEALPSLLRDGDTVLVKASHSMHFERIVDYIKTIR